jgi:hypothetical protein
VNFMASPSMCAPIGRGSPDLEYVLDFVAPEGIVSILGA